MAVTYTVLRDGRIHRKSITEAQMRAFVTGTLAQPAKVANDVVRFGSNVCKADGLDWIITKDGASKMKLEKS